MHPTQTHCGSQEHCCLDLQTSIKDLFNVDQLEAAERQPIEVKQKSEQLETEPTEKSETASEPSEVKITQNLFEQVRRAAFIKEGLTLVLFWISIMFDV